MPDRQTNDQVIRGRRLTVAWYNLVRPHTTLSRNPDRSMTPRTPAMAAGLLNHPWTLAEFIALAWIV